MVLQLVYMAAPNSVITVNILTRDESFPHSQLSLTKTWNILIKTSKPLLEMGIMLSCGSLLQHRFCVYCNRDMNHSLMQERLCNSVSQTVGLFISGSVVTERIRESEDGDKVKPCVGTACLTAWCKWCEAAVVKWYVTVIGSKPTATWQRLESCSGNGWKSRQVFVVKHSWISWKVN